MTKRRTTGYNIVLARVAETSSIEHLCKIKVLSSIEVYGKNATLANTRPVSCNFGTTNQNNRNGEAENRQSKHNKKTKN